MQTPAILNPASAVSAQKSPTPSTNGAGGDSAFQNMLSQQVAERQPNKPADNTQQAKPTDNQNTPAPPGDAKNTAAKSTDEGKTAQAADKPRQDDDKKVADDGTAIPPTATELIAQALNVPVRAETAPVEAKDKTDAAKDAALSPLARLRLSTAPDNAPKADLKDTKTATERAAKPGAAAASATDFGAAVKQAAGEHRQASAETFAEVHAAQIKGIALQADDNAPAVALNAAPTHLQQAGFELTQAAGQAERLTPRVGTPAWDQALGQKVVWMVAGTQQSASLTLNPPDLGPLQVVLNVHNGHADASFYAAQPEVRQALEAALPKLRDMMSDSGIQLGQTSVSAGTPDQFNQAAQQQAHAASRQSGQSSASTSADTTTVVRTQILRSGQGLVDTFV